MYVSYLALIQFVVVLIYLNLQLLVLRRNDKDNIRRIFALFVACCVWWGVAAIFRMSAPTKEIALVWGQVSSLGWITFPSFFLWFVLIFVKDETILKKKAFFPALFFLPVILLVVEWIQPLSVTTEKTVSGWNITWTGSPWVYLYFFFYSSFIIISLYFLYRYYRRTEIKLRKKQALIIIFSTLLSAVLGTTLAVLLPLLGLSPEISSGNTFTIFWALGMYYAVAKYNLFSPSFTLAGKNIIDNMSESLLLLDKSGRIIDANNQALKFLRIGKEDILNNELAGYFAGETLTAIRKMLENGVNLESMDTKIIFRDGSTSPVLFSCSRVLSEEAEMIGWVCMIGDISRQKQDEADLAAKNIELLDKLAELERFQKIVVDRELKMIELKKEIGDLKEKMTMK
jgi:PAS domain S-box-containing protein